MVVSAALVLTTAIGCGTTREYSATEQLVMSDAVDRSIASIDFRHMSGRKVYLDTSYLRHVKGEGFVNSEYVTSSLRQQVVAAGCLIQDASAEADIIIEARIGALGSAHLSHVLRNVVDTPYCNPRYLHRRHELVRSAG